MIATAGLFERYLDLAPLRARRRGVVTCIFHEDRTPSLSVDLDKVLFNCFGCGEHGGVRRFRELVGEASPSPGRRHRVQETEAERARRYVFEREARLARERAEWAPLVIASDFIRRSQRAIDAARVAATAMADTPRAWNLLELGARVEREALSVEGALDGILAEGRVA